MRPEKKSIEDWLADATFCGEQFYVQHGGGVIEAFFPRRENLSGPGQIDAALYLYPHPRWPKLDRMITRESAVRILLAICLADAIHETMEKVKLDGDPILDPHPFESVHEEDPAWICVLDAAQIAAETLMKGYPDGTQG